MEQQSIAIQRLKYFRDTINGQSNPEAISEPVAWGLLFRTLQSLSQDPQRAIAYQSYLNLMKLDPADQDGPGPRESEQVAFRRVVDRFATQVSQVDLEVARVKAVWRTTGRRQRDPFAERPCSSRLRSQCWLRRP